MSSWQIEPNEIQRILGEVLPQKTDLDSELTEAKFEAISAGLTWGGGVTSVVPGALSELLSDQSSALSSIVYRVNAGVLGVANATVAYNNGQEEMLGNFQREMLEAAVDGDFGYFEAHGYQGE